MISVGVWEHILKEIKWQCPFDPAFCPEEKYKGDCDLCLANRIVDALERIEKEHLNG